MKKNGGFFQGSVVITQIAPVETKPQFPALKNYLKWMKKQDKPLTENAEIGWVNADNFVTGLKMAGPSFTQAAVVDKLNTLTDYDAGRDARPARLDEAAHRPPLPAVVHRVPEGRQLEAEAGVGQARASRSSAGRSADSTKSVTKIKPTARQ